MLKQTALWLIVLLISSTAALAAVSINKVLVRPNATIQGSQSDFCLDVSYTGGGSAAGMVDVTYPDLSSWRLFLNIPDNTCFPNGLVGNGELKLTFADTSQIGNYILNFTAVKGAEFAKASSLLNVTPISPVITTIDKINSVGKLTNQSAMQVFGTEYTYGDDARVFLQLLEGNTPIVNATCFSTVYTPSGAVFADHTLMSLQPGSNGLYYADYTAPNISGVYMVEAECNYYSTTESHYVVSSSFSKGFITSGSIAFLNASDNQRLVVSENPQSQSIFAVFSAPFDETSGAFADETGIYNKDGSYFGSPNLTASAFSGTGVQFNGSSYAVFPIGNELYFNSTEDLGFCFTFNGNGTVTNNIPIADWYAGGEGFQVAGAAGNGLRFTTGRSASGAKNHDTIYSFTSGNPRLVCFFQNTTETTSYVDGTLNRLISTSQSGTMNASLGNITIGIDDSFSIFNDNDFVDDMCMVKGVHLNTALVVNTYNSTKTCSFAPGASSLSMNLTINATGHTLHHDRIRLTLEYQWTGNSPLNVSVYNASSGLFQQLVLLPTALSDASSSYSLGNITDLLNAAGLLTIAFTDTNATAAEQLSLDHVIMAGIDDIALPITVIRGGGELHITGYAAEQQSLLESIYSFLTVTVWGTLLEILGVAQENQLGINTTREQVLNLSLQAAGINQSLHDAIASANASSTASANAVQENITQQLRDLQDYLVYGESYG